MVIRDGLIEAIGADVAIPPDAVIKDMRGKTIYPGLIDIFTNYGLSAAPKKSGSSGQGEKSSNKNKGTNHWNKSVNSDKQAVELIKHNKKMAKALRGCGFTTVVAYPAEGIFKGSGALVQLNNDKINQSILSSNIAQAISFSKGKGFRSRSYPGSTMGCIALIRQTFLDAQWYQEAWTKFKKAPEGQNAPEVNSSLCSLKPYVNGLKPVIMETRDELEVLRAKKIADEFNLNMWILGSGYEYRRLQAIKNTNFKLILPLSFPKEPEVSTRESELNVELHELRHWDMAPENPGRITKVNIPFALTSTSLKKKSEFLSKLRIAVKRGLPANQALMALTETPAEWLQMSHILGSLEKGKLANFIITDGDLFKDKTKILDTWVSGQQFKISELPKVDIRGNWDLKITTKSKTDTGAIVISGKGKKLQAKLRLQNKKSKVKKVSLDDHLIMMIFPGDSSGIKGAARMTGVISKKTITGNGIWGDGDTFAWFAELTKPWKEKQDTTKPQPVKMADFPVVYPEGAFGNTAPPVQPEFLLIKNGTIWTSGPEGIVENGDLLIKNGKIIKIGKNLKAPSNATIINATGKHVSPGIIDAHCHVGITGGGNEATHAITSEVRIKDVINSDDINIYRQLAGGVTSVCTLHGSANPIGGTYAVIKLRWGTLPDEMVLFDAREGIKFALGENVKQSNWGSNPNPRYPQTRMGVMEIIRDAFMAAKDYRQEWKQYKKQSKKNKNLIPPLRNLRHEALLEVLDGKTIIHCHSYRQDEILAMMRLAEELGIKVDVFIHTFEGYKVAAELKKHGSMSTSSTDWWAYKMEADDGIPYNGALMYDQGIVVGYNSDSAELGRRLNTEAAKAVKYGNVPPEEALKFVTLNAAKHLFLEDRIGSLEKGKDADFAIWSHSPLSTYSKCEQTWVDGRKYFDLKQDAILRKKVSKERNTLIQKILCKSIKPEKQDNKGKNK